MKSEKDNQKSYWDTRAKSFPRHQDGEDTYQASMLELARRKGMDFKNKKIMDLGCGTGSYAIRLAREAASLTALDISEGMLETLAEDARQNGLTNIECVCSDWLDYKAGEKFDIIFCSLTPALKDIEGVKKLCDCKGSQIVYIGFAGPMKAQSLDGLYEIHKAEKITGKYEPVVRPWLEQNHIPHTVESVQGEWLRQWSRQELIHNFTHVLIAHNITPDNALIEEYVEKFRTGDGRYVTATFYNVEMVLWKNEPAG